MYCSKTGMLPFGGMMFLSIMISLSRERVKINRNIFLNIYESKKANPQIGFEESQREREKTGELKS